MPHVRVIWCHSSLLNFRRCCYSNRALAVLSAHKGWDEDTLGILMRVAPERKIQIKFSASFNLIWKGNLRGNLQSTSRFSGLLFGECARSCLNLSFLIYLRTFADWNEFVWKSAVERERSLGTVCLHPRWQLIPETINWAHGNVKIRGFCDKTTCLCATFVSKDLCSICTRYTSVLSRKHSEWFVFWRCDGVLALITVKSFVFRHQCKRNKPTKRAEKRVLSCAKNGRLLSPLRPSSSKISFPNGAPGTAKAAVFITANYERPFV